MQKLFVMLSLVASLQTSVLADFSRSQLGLHPHYPAAGPFIIEISGTWPSDCHPGEQKPLVASWDGQTVKIEFEIIVVHITCNDVDTDYRVLVDMSAAVRTMSPLGDKLAVQVSFGGETWEQTVDLVCPTVGECAGKAVRQVELGLYHAPGLMNQGLLVARQNDATAIYPLVYDDAGLSQWVFTGNLMVEDAFFSEALIFSGGDCFGCEPTGAKPDITRAGDLTVLADRPGVLLVKANDGLFSEYHSLVYGYHLEGRWGINENHGTDPPLGDLTNFFPGVFDVEREDIVTANPELQQDGQVSYLVNSPTGEILGQLLCRGQTAADGVTPVCEFIDPTDAAEPLFLFYQRGPSSLAIEYGRAVVAIGRAPGGQAVRLN
jgi:hypothetical protein